MRETVLDLGSTSIAAGSEAVAAAVVDSSFLEQDEKDNVGLLK